MDTMSAIWANLQEIDEILRQFYNKGLDGKATKDSISRLKDEAKRRFVWICQANM